MDKGTLVLGGIGGLALIALVSLFTTLETSDRGPTICVIHEPRISVQSDGTVITDQAAVTCGGHPAQMRFRKGLVPTDAHATERFRCELMHYRNHLAFGLAERFGVKDGGAHWTGQNCRV